MEITRDEAIHFALRRNYDPSRFADCRTTDDLVKVEFDLAVKRRAHFRRPISREEALAYARDRHMDPARFESCRTRGDLYRVNIELRGEVRLALARSHIELFLDYLHPTPWWKRLWKRIVAILNPRP